MTALSTAEQRQKIGYLRKLLALDDELYYEMIAGYNGAKSSKELSANEAHVLINRLRDNAKAAGLWKGKASFQKYKYNNLNDRQGMASAKQLRFIEAMWHDISRANDENGKAYTLRVFLKRITGKDALSFLTSKDVRKVIEALKAMRGGVNEGVKKVWSVECEVINSPLSTLGRGSGRGAQEARSPKAPLSNSLPKGGERIGYKSDPPKGRG